VRRAAVAARLARAWARILWEVRGRRYDAVLLGDFALSLPTAAALALSARPRRPLLVDVCHNVRPFNKWGGDDLHESSPLLLALLRRLYPRLDLVLAHGERSRAKFEATWPPARLAVIPHGDERLFTSEPPPPSEEERILFFGDWRKLKGLDVLMEAFDELARRAPEARLTIAGTPSPEVDQAAIRAWAAGHGERVRLVERYVPIEEVEELFGRSRLVVTPYLVGDQSGVVHLAMTMARAVVSSDVGDLPASVAHGETGLVVPAADPGALASALERVVTDAKLAGRLGTEGRRRVLERSGWERVAERVETELSQVSRS
jgi:starch synthase